MKKRVRDTEEIGSVGLRSQNVHMRYFGEKRYRIIANDLVYEADFDT